jgi:hypothetical protein
MVEMRNSYTILVGELKGRNYVEDVGVDERLILKSVIKR